MTGGCADSKSRGEAAEQARLISAAEIITAFDSQTGYKLVSHKSPALPGVPRVQRLDLPGNKSNPTPKELVQRYGYFSIFVYGTPREARGALRGPPPDKWGVYWTEAEIERGPEAGKKTLVAEKFYPRNLILSWSPERRRLDVRWRRLDAFLNGIVKAQS